MKYKRIFFIALSLGAIALSILSHESNFTNLYSLNNPVDLLVLY